MATTKTKTTSKKSTPARASSRKGPRAASLDRLNTSLEAAQKALTDLGSSLGRGGRDVLKDVQKMVRDARRDTARLNKTLLADLDQLQKTVTGRGGRSASQKSATARKKATRKAATGRSASKRSSKSAASKRAAKK